MTSVLPPSTYVILVCAGGQEIKITAERPLVIPEYGDPHVSEQHEIWECFHIRIKSVHYRTRTQVMCEYF